MLWEYIKSKMLKAPNTIMGEENGIMTYEEVIIYAETYAKKLQGPCYAILCQSELMTAIAILSCLAAGVTAVPISYKYGDIHCRKIFDSIKPPYAISDVDGELKIIDIDLGEYHDDPEDRPALIMCTSGTTGSPKGAMISEKNLLTNIKDIESYFDIGNTDTILVARPLYHCAVLTGEFLTSLVKCTNIIFYSGKADPKKLINIIKSHQITVMGGTPTLFQMIERLNRGKSSLFSLKNIVVSGESLAGSVAVKIREIAPDARIYHVYGLTEASPRVLWLPPQDFEEYCEYSGLPLPSLEIKIIDENGTQLPANIEGELCVRGNSIMKGYYNQPELTEKVIRDGWLHTGDIAYINEKGFVRIKGRKDNLIIKAGINIYPQEIENTLKTDKRVEEVVAYGISDPFFGQKIGLEIKGAFSDKSEVIKLCHELLPTYEYPAVVEIVDEIPKNGSGKIIRKLRDYNG